MRCLFIVLTLVSNFALAEDIIKLRGCDEVIDTEVFDGRSGERKIIVQEGIRCWSSGQCQGRERQIQQQQPSQGRRLQIMHQSEVKTLKNGEVVDYKGQLYSCSADF